MIYSVRLICGYKGAEYKIRLSYNIYFVLNEMICKNDVYILGKKLHKQFI